MGHFLSQDSLACSGCAEKKYPPPGLEKQWSCRCLSATGKGRRRRSAPAPPLRPPPLGSRSRSRRRPKPRPSASDRSHGGQREPPLMREPMAAGRRGRRPERPRFQPSPRSPPGRPRRLQRGGMEAGRRRRRRRRRPCPAGGRPPRHSDRSRAGRRPRRRSPSPIQRGGKTAVTTRSLLKQRQVKQQIQKGQVAWHRRGVEVCCQQKEPKTQAKPRLPPPKPIRSTLPKREQPHRPPACRHRPWPRC